ncbi:hypothetical protein VNO77_00910 [Canavalia gladiata]|uniref:VQ domain-containing protein n=1 Tax=Canavalia gladiata TaxID=3824 RepID=A0AAN9R4H9_CANGL
MQSSSGAEEEYDSRAESSSLAAFLNNQQPQTQVASFATTDTNLPLIPSQNSHIFDPLSNYLDRSNSLLNLDVMWSKQGRSEPNQTHFGGFIPCSISSSSSLSRGCSNNNINNSTGAFSTSTHQILPPESGSRGPMLSVSAANNDQTNNNSSNNNNMVRNPKKRSRASRRAPTTVLTTDTTNFRAMVQEFTGIPAPPFTPSPFPRTRLDLFASSTLRSSCNLLDPPTTAPPYLLRPFPHKPRNLHPFPPSFSTVENLLLPSNNSTNNNSTTNSTSINYQQLQPLNFDAQNPVLGFQNSTTFLASSPKYHPLGNSSVLVSKTQPSLEIPQNLKMGVLEELGLRHDHHVNTDLNCLHHNMVSSTSVGVRALSSVNNNNNNLTNASSSTEWAQRTGTITNNDCDHGGGGRGRGGVLSGTVNYSDVAERLTNGKVHYSASSSDFHGDKGPDFTVPQRTQGMVESWINCSSD